MTDFQRLEDIKKYIGLSYNKMASEMGFKSSQVFYDIKAGKCGISYETAQKIQEFLKSKGLTPFCERWLMTGEGDKFPTDATAQSLSDVNSSSKKKDVLMVPVINLDARGGLLAPQETDTAEYVTELVPFASSVAQRGDVVIPMYGDSMYPRYPSGSRLLIRQVENWKEYLELGASYVIELTDGRRVVKIVKKGTDNAHYQLVSVNPEYETQEIPISIINRVFLVKMMLKNETV